MQPAVNVSAALSAELPPVKTGVGDFYFTLLKLKTPCIEKASNYKSVDAVISPVRLTVSLLPIKYIYVFIIV